MTTSTQTVTCVGIASAVALSVMNSSSSPLIWATLNQNQLLLLFIVLNSYIIEDVRNLLLSQSFALFNFNFIDYPKYFELEDPLEWVGDEQKKLNLEELEFESSSAFNNCISLFITLIYMIIFHVILLLIPGSINPSDGEPGKCKKIWVKIRTSTLTTFKYATYVRLALEAHESLIISSSSEIYNKNNDAAGKYFSLVMAILILVGTLVLLALTVISYIRDSKREDPEEKFIFMEFYSEVKPKRISKLYTINLLIRRTLFVFISIFLNDVNKNVAFSLLLLLQLIYLIQFAVIRPYIDKVPNLVELINECFFFIFICLFFGLNDNESWSEAAETSAIVLLSLNNMVIVLIIICKFI